jgi:hypothetical protein
LHREANPEKYRERNRQYYLANPEKFGELARERNRRYYAANRDRLRRAFRLKKHRLPEEAFLEMMRLQVNACGICGRPITEATCEIDHCHATMVVRGLLCESCNKGIGLLGDSPETVRGALAYLEKAQIKT